jgi:hypothetical protein
MDGSERQVVAFADLMERAAGWFDAFAGRVPRAKQNRRTGDRELQIRTVQLLTGVFQRELGHPYYGHVATIAEVVSEISTGAEFVKKVKARQSAPNMPGAR